MNTEQELRPAACPFCAAALVENGELVRFWKHPVRSLEEAKCPGSHVSIEFHPEPDNEALARWNRRSSDEQAEVVGWTDEAEIKALAEHGHGLINARRDEGAGFVVPLYRAPPAVAKCGVTDIPWRDETDAEHIARDMRDGHFPKRSERQKRPAIADAWERIRDDDELTRVRSRLSMHELRRIIHHATEAHAALTAALAVGDEGIREGWQGIETAPKDGRSILISGRYPNGVVYVEEGHRTFSGHFSTRKLDPPTHWMPLPTPPSRGEGE